MLSLAHIAKALQSELACEVVGDGSVLVTAVSTDTRTISGGQTFLALRGPNHDGHDHIDAAIAAGVDAIIVEQKSDKDIAQLVVSDTRLALGQLARLWCQKYSAQRLAITGSNGKTTVKEMIAAILRCSVEREGGAKVLATPGNLNNDIGLPLTCLSLQAEHRYAVLEMGTSSNGEIGYLSALAAPEIALVNSVAAAHLEGFDSVQSIAHEKASIFSGLDAEGLAVFPLATPYTTIFRQASAHCKTLTFELTDSVAANSNADVVADVATDVVTDLATTAHKATNDQQHEPTVTNSARITLSQNLDSKLCGKSFNISLQLLGRHNLLNAVAAIATVCTLDVSEEDIVKGLASVEAVPGRLQLRNGSPACLIDDTYNANPASMHAAIDLLAGYPGKRVLVMGDMKELGDEELQLHAEAGRYAKDAGIESLIAVGALAAHAAVEFGKNGDSYSSKTEVAELLHKQISAEHTVLFKGSRSARMEEIIDQLLELAKGDSPDGLPPGSAAVESSSVSSSDDASDITARIDTRPVKGSGDHQSNIGISQRLVYS